MAKIGTLVPKETVEFNDDETKFIRDMLIGFLREFSTDGNASMEFDVDVEDHTDYRHYVVIYVNSTKYDVCYRLNHSKNLVCPKYLRIAFYKKKCYDEEEEGKFYEWESMGKGKDYKPELKYVNYTAYVTLFGDERKYRSRRTNKDVALSDGDVSLYGYSFGTELSDLSDDIHDVLEKIDRSLKNSRIEKRNPLK